MDPNKYLFNLEKSLTDSRDLMLESVYPDTVILPKIWDYRKQMQPIRDQGQQGSCSAQTAGAIRECQEKIENPQFNEYMSPQFIYNLRSEGGTSGMTPRDTMEILYKIGIVPEESYKYGTFKPISEDLRTAAAKYKIQGYAQINTLDSLQKALFAHGPCYIAFPVYNPENLEFWVPESIGQQMMGGHALCVAGYLEESFIIRNSWSSAWGDAGYTYFPFTQWGMQWEAWTAIDADSNSDTLADKVEQVTCTPESCEEIIEKK